MEKISDKFAVIACAGGGLAVGIWALGKLSDYHNKKSQEKLFQERCSQWPKDTVIVHGIRRGKLTPHISPFVMKLETFLRMHNIPYLFEHEFPKGDKEKMPWITLNGEHYTDSQLIIKFLTRKYDLKPKGNYNENERAVGTMARVVADEHIFWGLLLWRYVYSKGDHLDAMFNLTPKELKAMEERSFKKYTQYSWMQGIGRHSKEEVIQFICDDLKALSNVLGSKKFLLGDEPSEDDCSLFGMLAQFVWNDTKSPFTKLINDELPNLREYCFRMKDLFWKDWDEVIKVACDEFKKFCS